MQGITTLLSIMPLREGAGRCFFRNGLPFLEALPGVTRSQRPSSSDAVLTKQKASGQDNEGRKILARFMVFTKRL